MPFVEIEGKRVHYAERRGGRRPVVFLHGGFGSSSELWTRAMEALPPEYSAFAIDNFLRSDAPPGGYSVPQFAHRAGRFIEQLGLERAVLVGHSMGGVTVQLAALEFPASTEGLVLVCTGPAMTNHEAARRWLNELRDEGHKPGTIREISRNWFHRPVPEFFEGYAQRAETAPLQAMIDVQASLIETDVRPRLHEIACPALVVWGRYDTGRTMEHARALLDGIPDSEFAPMEESGHSPMVETPQAFDAAFHRFLDRLPWDRAREDEPSKRRRGQ
jgi:pimeloyl-ACP methyl ester carboxylesterase